MLPKKKNSEETKDGNHQNLPCLLMTPVIFCGVGGYGMGMGVGVMVLPHTICYSYVA